MINLLTANTSNLTYRQFHMLSSFRYNGVQIRKLNQNSNILIGTFQSGIEQAFDLTFFIPSPTHHQQINQTTAHQISNCP